MKTKVLLTTLVLVTIISAFGQRQTLDLTFTAVDNSAYIKLDSIKVMNRTQSCDTVLYYPDTTLTLDFPVGLPRQNKGTEEFRVFQNYPNPSKEKTSIGIWVPASDNVRLSVHDFLGRQVTLLDLKLAKGYHMFDFVPGHEAFYLFSATWNGITRSIKMFAYTGNSASQSDLIYDGIKEDEHILKSMPTALGFIYDWGDVLLAIGYTNNLESGMLDSPINDKTYIFQFATNIPCPGTPTVTYEGQVYNTIQIFSQCWLKENLNVGSMINGSQNQTNNSIIEKYCFNNDPSNCVTYGGLYQWDEMMQYTTTQGVQGICPPGWNLPMDEEWKVLEGTVDSQYEIGDPQWDAGNGYRGFDAGLNLKSISGWNLGGNGTDLFGFSGLPGGILDYDDVFLFLGSYGLWWSSTEIGYHAWDRYLYSDSPLVLRYGNIKDYAFSVRCIKDN